MAFRLVRARYDRQISERMLSSETIVLAVATPPEACVTNEFHLRCDEPCLCDFIFVRTPERNSSCPGQPGIGRATFHKR